VSYLTVHALGGEAMIRGSVEAVSRSAALEGGPPPKVLAVTILTSHDAAQLDRLGLAGPPTSAVSRLAALARAAGAGGVVCSPLEIGAVRAALPEGTIVVPGIRPAGQAAGEDQKRVATPARALADGADRLVVGRPITAAADPVEAARALLAELEAGGAR
jgi:orotidine-5'-phosphate decarboxylase